MKDPVVTLEAEPGVDDWTTEQWAQHALDLRGRIFDMRAERDAAISQHVATLAITDRLTVALLAGGACQRDVETGDLVAGETWPALDGVSCTLCGDCYCSGGPSCSALDGVTIDRAEQVYRDALNNFQREQA